MWLLMKEQPPPPAVSYVQLNMIGWLALHMSEDPGSHLGLHIGCSLETFRFSDILQANSGMTQIRAQLFPSHHFKLITCKLCCHSAVYSWGCHIASGLCFSVTTFQFGIFVS
jgi:hypothetical protein